jgi:hypothetical protein
MTRLPCHYPRPDRYPAAPGQSVKSAFRLFVRAAKKPNHRHRRLLRARRERADELAAFQLNELHSIPASSPRRRGTESRRPWPRRRRHPARRFANGRPRSSLMMQAKSRRCRVAQSRATKKGSAARRRRSPVAANIAPRDTPIAEALRQAPCDMFGPRSCVLWVMNVQALLWRAGNVALNRAPDLATAPSFMSSSRTG